MKMIDKVLEKILLNKGFSIKPDTQGNYGCNISYKNKTVFISYYFFEQKNSLETKQQLFNMLKKIKINI